MQLCALGSFDLNRTFVSFSLDDIKLHENITSISTEMIHLGLIGRSVFIAGTIEVRERNFVDKTRKRWKCPWWNTHFRTIDQTPSCVRDCAPWLFGRELDATQISEKKP